MAKKNALGRGLGALIDSGDEPSEISSYQRRLSGIAEISLDTIDSNPYQPRTIFDQESLEELASSIKEIGIIQPITVRKSVNGRYQLITGERRLRATKLAGLSRIPAYMREAEDKNLLEMALVENIQREDLDAIEIAISYQRLIDECDLTQESLSQRVGKKRATVANYLRLLKLPAEIQLGIKDHTISMGHARSLVNIDDPKIQLKIYKKIINQELSVRKVEELVRKLGQEKETVSGTPKIIPRDYEKLKDHLQKFFSSKVEFKRNNKGVGKIVIPFDSDDDLERIIAIFDKLNT
ncbi:MAG: ParB/RepB/Spo0J family partition protein [Bacteroidales bacterium]|jgi:ParB family chromosome partitioning protein|nr:ParB/RepB/Spo0J family partition protein [Bacteroidales bacterium]